MSDPITITTLDDLDHMQDTMADNRPVVVEDKSQRVWTLVEDVGVLWANHCDSATWRPAQEVLAAYGPLRVLQDLTEQIATEVRRWQQVADAVISEASGPPCKAAIMIKGEHFPCDWPTSKDGTHDGWKHANREAEAVWRGGPVPTEDALGEQFDRLRAQITLRDNGWVPFGWHIAYPDVRLEFDGESECGDPVWERNADWGLTPTELEADRNAAQGREEADRNARGGS